MNTSAEYFPNHPAAAEKVRTLRAAAAGNGYDTVFEEYLPDYQQVVLVFRQLRRGERDTRLRVEGHVNLRTGRVCWDADGEHHSGDSRPGTRTAALVSWLRFHAVSR